MLALTEESARTYTATLKGQPTSAVVVDVSSDTPRAVEHAVGGTADTTSYPTMLDLTAVDVTDNDTPGLGGECDGSDDERGG